MTAVKVLGICGSTRKSSLNRALLRTVGEHLPEGTVFATWEGLEQLPIFNSDLEDPTPVMTLKSAIASADGVVFAVPEYNYSIPGGLKNALDWVSRPPVSSPLRGKPVALVGAATGISGTMRAQLHMRQMLVYSDTPCMSQPEVLIPRAHERFDKAGVLTDEPTRQLIIRFANAFVAHIRRYELK